MLCKLTTRTVASLPSSPERPTLYYDSELPGFGVRVSGSTRSFILEGRLKGSSRAVRVTLGRADRITVASARELARVALGELAHGINPNVRDRESRQHAAEAIVGRVTLKAAFDEYLEGRRLRPHTLRDYRGDMRRHFGGWLDKPITAITREEIERRYREACDRALTGKGGKLRKSSDGRTIHGGATSASRAFRLLSSVFAYALEKYRRRDGSPVLASGNPVLVLSKLRQWQPMQARRRIVPVERLGALLDALDPTGDDYLDLVRDAVSVALFSGCRRSEILSLAWAAVDEVRRKFILTETKNGKPHTVYFGDHLAAVFKRRRDASVGSKFVFATSGRSEHLRFPDHAIARICRDCGVEFCLHDLRRSFVTLAVEHLGFDLSAAKALVNHSVGKDVALSSYVVRAAATARNRTLAIEHFILVQAGRLAMASVRAPSVERPTQPTSEEAA